VVKPITHILKVKEMRISFSGLSKTPFIASLITKNGVLDVYIIRFNILSGQPIIYSDSNTVVFKSRNNEPFKVLLRLYEGGVATL